MNKRELVEWVFRNEPAERVPVGFWLHYAKDELEDVFMNPALREINVQGHERFFREFQPDFLKIMTDGYFVYPNEPFVRAERAGDLRAAAPLGPNHPWIREQIRFARELTGAYGSEVLTFYNIFSPVTYFKFVRRGTVENPYGLLMDFIREDKGAVIHGLAAAAQDIAALAQGVIAEGGADGLYYSVQDLGDPRMPEELRREVLVPPDFAVLEAANALSDLNILHICSYAGHPNQVAHFADYPAQIINWAAVQEKLPLGEGKRIFGGKPVIGGFGNTTADLLYRGTREEIEGETDRLLAEAGRRGVVLGADCTIPRDISLDHLRWVRDRAAGSPGPHRR
jgi:uroporphyrinogen decarboxylase